MTRREDFRVQMATVAYLKATGISFIKPVPPREELSEFIATKYGLAAFPEDWMFNIHQFYQQRKREVDLAHVERKRVAAEKKAEYDRLNEERRAQRRMKKNKQPRTKPSKKSYREFQEFYVSKEWLQLRYKAIKKYGRVCMCCGSKGIIHVDHIKPRSKYPLLELDIDNLQILCEGCNFGKGGWDQTDWRQQNVKEA